MKKITTYENLRDDVKEMLKGNFIVIYAYIKNEDLK